MKKLIIILSFAIFSLYGYSQFAGIFGSTNPVYGVKYYIATDGNDATGDGSKGNPWKTWQKIDSVALDPGDIIYIRGGTYTDDRVTTDYFCYWDSIVGTESNPIVIMAYPGETPVWDFTGLSDPSDGVTYLLQMIECEYVRVEGLRLTKAAQPGTDPIIAWNITNSQRVTIEN